MNLVTVVNIVEITEEPDDIATIADLVGER